MEKAVRILEFDKIRKELAELCVSGPGMEKAEALMPMRTGQEVESALAETQEAETVLLRTGISPMRSFTGVRESLKLARIGAALPPKALLQIAELLRAAGAAKTALVHGKEDTVPAPRLSQLAAGLVTLRELEQTISQAILSEEEIADRASPALFQIRRKIRGCNDRVREKLGGMIHSTAFQKYLQDPIITMRQDRYVLPVRQEYRTMVPGIVHDQSTSGATLFIEPMAVVEIGNELKRLLSEEREEIERILLELSARIAPEEDTIARDQDILTHLDFVFAKAMLGRKMHAVTPKVNGEGRIRIVRGRHPLIDPEKVVPLDIWLGDKFTTLVITGPNTGGKTVTLKTAGLFCLMAQAGLQVPGEEGTELSVFDTVFADIGDEQSIEQSLSTFSGHMRNIVSILDRVTPRSLVLFDELGAGTDPTEGAALAQAVLSTLLEKGTRTMATTHYSELKEYAMTTPGVENASVEFDVATLAPTYHLLIGIPGKSNAFEISRKLGLPEGIIENARALLSQGQVRFEDVLANAELYRQEAERDRQLAEEAREEMQQLRSQVRQEKEKLQKERERSREKAKDEARRIVDKARREGEQLLTDMREMKRQGQVQAHQLDQARKKLEELGAEPEAERTEEAAPLQKVSVGEMVHVVSMDMEAAVTAPPDAKGYVQLKAGPMKMRVHLSDLRALSDREREVRKQKRKQEARQSYKSSRIDIAQRQVRQEIDLRGLAADEAIPEVQKFLDDAMLSSLGEVSIIHGNGTGILRARIQELLRRHPSVKSFRAGRYGEGETGVTIVQLK